MVISWQTFPAYAFWFDRAGADYRSIEIKKNNFQARMATNVNIEEYRYRLYCNVIMLQIVILQRTGPRQRSGSLFNI